MSRLFYHTMQDNVGNLLFGVSGTMRLAGSGTLATIYGDEALTVILPNPMTNHPSFGSFKCFLGAGDYDFYMAKAGYTFETLTGVQGHGTMAQQDASAVLITGGNAVLSTGQIANLGIGRTPDLNYGLAVGPAVPSFFASEVGMGRVPSPAYALSIGNLPSYFETNVTIAGTTQHVGIVGIQSTPNPTYALVVGNLPSYFETNVTINGMTHHLGVVGIQRTPNAAYALSVGTLPSYFDTAVTIAGTTHMLGILGIQRTPNAAYALSVGTLPSYFDTAVTVAGLFSAANVAITGGSLIGLSRLDVGTLGGALPVGYMQLIRYDHATTYGMQFLPSTDAGSMAALHFLNAGGTAVGYIVTTGSATNYNTTSDARLKHDVEDLTGELALVEALRPVRFKWNLDDSAGVGFLAHEVAALVDGVISGEPDVLEEDGRIRPQGIDYGKLVPWLVGAVKTLAAQVQALTARLDAV